MSGSQKKGPAIARVTFIRHQAMIEKEFRDGWSGLAIYQRHKDEFSTISYRQFLRYISAWRSPRLQAARASPKPERRPQRNPPAQQTADRLPVDDPPDQDEPAPIREPRHKFLGVPATNRVKPKPETM